MNLSYMYRPLTRCLANFYSALKTTLYVFAGQGSQARGMLDHIDH